MWIALLVPVGLGGLILVHEFGHAVAARLAGLSVLDFSLGLGPSFARLRWGSTTIRFGVIPFGGFVRVAELEPGVEGADRFRPRSVVGRLLVTLAGPLANYLVAAMLAAAVAAGWGVDTGRVIGLQVTATGEHGAAAGLQVGDVVVAVGERHIERVADLAPAFGATGGGPAQLRVLRDGRPVELVAQPIRSNGRWGLGARYAVLPDLQPVQPPGALAAGLAYPVERSIELLRNAASMLAPNTGVRPVSAVGLADRVSRAGAWDARRVLALLALLSVVVGLFNLLPLPGLDGGRAVLEVVEAARRRRLPARWAIGIQVAGGVVLLGLWLVLGMTELL